MSLISLPKALGPSVFPNSVNPEQPLALASTASSLVVPAEVSVFYSHPFGQCWAGLTIDSKNNLYPVNTAGVYKILSNGTLVNGVNDANLFAYGTATDSVALDDKGGKFYSIGEVGYSGPFYVSAAPFVEGSTFNPLIYGLSGSGRVALGRGLLQNNLFVTETLQNKVARVSLSPLALTEFGNSSIFQAPSAIASAADGTIYVSNLDVGYYGQNLGNIFLTKIAPDGTISRFLNGSNAAPNLDDVLAVDKTGNVYWGNALAINKYDSQGNLLGTLSGPPDMRSYFYIFGGVFDSKGNLYLVDNDGCQKIYKYTFLPQPKVSLSMFITDAGLNALPTDAQGGFKLNVIIANSIVRGTNPGQILTWVNLTNTGSLGIQSLGLEETLPSDWTIQPSWLPGTSAIHLFLANTTNLAADPEITQPSTITATKGNPEVVNLAIQSFNATAIGHPLLPGQSILLSVKIIYSLRGTSQPTTSYPRTYLDTATANVWPQASFMGVQASRSNSTSLTAYAKVLGKGSSI